MYYSKYAASGLHFLVNPYKQTYLGKARDLFCADIQLPRVVPHSHRSSFCAYMYCAFTYTSRHLLLLHLSSSVHSFVFKQMVQLYSL